MNKLFLFMNLNWTFFPMLAARQNSGGVERNALQSWTDLF